MRPASERVRKFILGGTGHGPVPPGDSPSGMGRAPGANKELPSARGCLTLPVGESPPGTGGSPVLPIFRTRSQPRSATVGEAPVAATLRETLGSREDPASRVTQPRAPSAIHLSQSNLIPDQ